jgi:outer membrane protein, heavy metal efflux system
MPIHAHGPRSNGRTRSTALCLFLGLAGVATGSFAGVTNEAPAPLAADAPSGDSVSLADALAAALLHNPELAAYPFEVRAQDARALQEGLLPNPSLSTEVENFGRWGGSGGDVEATQVTVGLTQLVELAGKRGKRRSLARLEGRLAGWDYERARRDTVAKTLKAFVAGLLAQERVALAERLHTLARDALGAVRKQVDAGAASPGDLARAESALAQAEASRASRERALRAARIQLATTWGSVTPQFTTLRGALEPLTPPRPFEAIRNGLTANPDLGRWETAIERADAAVRLEEARRVPDVTLRVGSRRFVSAETNALVAEFSVPLPVFNRNQGAIQEAYERLGRTRAEKEAATLGAEVALRATYEELVAAFEQARDLHDHVLPPSQRALDAARRGYAQGMLRYLDVLDAQRTVAELRGDYLEALGRFHTAAADLERLTGTPAVAAAASGQ